MSEDTHTRGTNTVRFVDQDTPNRMAPQGRALGMTPRRLHMETPMMAASEADIETDDQFDTYYKRYIGMAKEIEVYDADRYTMEQFLKMIESKVKEAHLPVSWAVNLSITKILASKAESERAFVDAWLEGHDLDMATARAKIKWSNSAYVRGMPPGASNVPGWKEVLLGMSMDASKQDDAIKKLHALKVGRDPMAFFRNFERLYVLAGEDAPRTAVFQLLQKMPASYASLRRETLQYKSQCFRNGTDLDVSYLCQHLRDCHASRGGTQDEEEISLNNVNKERRGRSGWRGGGREDRKGDKALPLRNEKGDPLCFNCNKYGHFARDCRTKTTRSVNAVATEETERADANAVDPNEESRG